MPPTILFPMIRRLKENTRVARYRVYDNAWALNSIHFTIEYRCNEESEVEILRGILNFLYFICKESFASIHQLLIVCKIVAHYEFSNSHKNRILLLLMPERTIHLCTIYLRAKLVPLLHKKVLYNVCNCCWKVNFYLRKNSWTLMRISY